MSCHCGSGKEFSACCEVYISGKELPPTPEATMRSRYSAFATKNIEYIRDTHDQSTVSDFDMAHTKEWAEHSTWLGLEVVSSSEDGDNGQVEFKAKYAVEGNEIVHHELSDFAKRDGKWFFVDGKVFNTPIARTSAKVGRNDPCTCGSGKKFKKCCGR